ncbi:MAG: FAD-binding oxidoreductase, partial [Myxococcales bacterium]|nr:FAD-binding oxidoreductase [Myxococcales bacterium]
YAEGARQRGVEIRTFTEVVDVETANGKVIAVRTPDERIRTSLVLNAAGAWSPEIARMVGVDLPTKPHRHEICSTEPLKPFLKPLVADLASGLYFSQSMRGEIVGGISNAEVPEGLDQGSSLRFLGLYARALTRAMPRLGAVRVLRQWAGCYDLTVDRAPIIGRVDGVEGFILMSGFIGHGFMIAPIMARIMAKYLVQDVDHPTFTSWAFYRFRDGNLCGETMVLG